MKRRSRLTRSLAAGLIALLGHWASAAAAAPDARVLVGDGLAAYADAQTQTERDLRLEAFRRAERLFAQAVATGASSAELQTNLGNAALQAERIGPAILAYRRALVLEPGLERARQNLRHARSLLPSWIPIPQSGGVLDSFFAWHQTLPREARSNAASLSFLLFGLFCAAAIYRRSGPLAWLSGLPALACLALLASVAMDPARSAEREGVVMLQEVVARAADSANAPVLFSDPLAEGTELEILEDRDAWLQIRLYNGRSAWVSAAGIERVAEP